jgi:hypothetical protein
VGGAEVKGGREMKAEKERERKYDPADIVMNLVTVIRGDILELKDVMSSIASRPGITIIYQKVSNNKFMVSEEGEHVPKAGRD